MLCYVILCDVMLSYVMLCNVMLCYIMLCYVMLCYIVLYHKIMRQITFFNSILSKKESTYHYRAMAHVRSILKQRKFVKIQCTVFEIFSNYE